MDQGTIRKLLEMVATGEMTAERALEGLSSLPFADLGVAKHDCHRPLRNGFSEVILCEGKRADQVISIVSGAKSRELNVFGTRAEPSLLETLAREFPGIETDEQSRTFCIMKRSPEPIQGKLAILTGGTADIGVAEEAARTARFFGVEARRHYDVGVAGLHRLLSCIEEVRLADVIVVAAGMEGALPSVVGGLVGSPVIAVPTSAGYGASFGGVAALLGMLNSCSEGITVVNIDNGFGAACAAVRMLRSRNGVNKTRQSP